MQHLRGALLGVVCCFFAATLLGAVNPDVVKKLKIGDSVNVTLKTGGMVNGTVQVIDPAFAFIRVRTKVAEVRVAVDDMESLERIATPKEIYDERSKNCKTADDWLKLGNEMVLKGESTLADQAFEEGLKLDPNHAGIHEKRGEVFYEEKWMPEAEMHKLKGDVLIDGKWHDSESAAQARKEQEERLKNIKLKGQKELEAEYLGRPWGKDPAGMKAGGREGGGEPVVSAHYEVYCDSTDEVAKYYSNIMENLYSKYSEEFSKYTKVDTKKGTIIIAKNRQQFLDWTGMPEGVGGYYRIFEKDVNAYHGTFASTATTYEVLAHEGTHQFQGFVLKNFFGAPNWVIEGQAVFYGDGSKYNEKTGSITVGLIPRFRLIDLQEIIGGGNYEAIKADRLMMTGPPFPGFYYAPAWGVIFWCMKGHQQKVKAHNGDGVEVFTEFFKAVIANDRPCDYPAELQRFKNLIKTKIGKDFDVWEKEYADWIMKLPIENLMRKTGDKWESDTLNFKIKQPAGWKQDQALRNGEQIAFTAPGKHRRISTFADGNGALAELSTELGERMLQGFYAEIEWIDEPNEKTVVGFPAVEAVFTGKPILRKESGQGGQQPAQQTQNAEVQVVKCRAVVYATVDRIRMNLLECDPSEYDATNGQVFEKYLRDYEASD